MFNFDVWDLFFMKSIQIILSSFLMVILIYLSNLKIQIVFFVCDTCQFRLF